MNDFGQVVVKRKRMHANSGVISKISVSGGADKLECCGGFLKVNDLCAVKFDRRSVYLRILVVSS